MSLDVLSAECPPEVLAARAGGKAAQLAALERLGCAVPPWFCVPVEAFDRALADAVRRAGGALADAVPTGVEALPVPEEVAAAVRTALADSGLEGAHVAVRSSGLDEDAPDRSYAGQFASYLYRRGADAVLDALGRCWASAFSERNVAYRRALEAEGELGVPRMGVIVQLMVDSESAGVAFSRNPLDPSDRDTLVIESVWGQGEGVVGGGLDADRFEVNRATLAFDATVASKTHALVHDPERGGTRRVPVEEGRVGRPSLTRSQVEDVATLALRLEVELGRPQDCEWAISDGSLFVLQTRPITTLPPDAVFDERVSGDDVVIWDNSNIIESYSGVTTPLTFSHVSRAYREVYHQTCRLMRVPAGVVREHETVFRNMLGLVRGRIYYNLLNWYRLLALFPLLGRSGAFMETMMGVKQSLEADLQPLFDSVLADAPRYGFFRRAALLARLCWRMVGGARANAEFLDRVEGVCRPLERADLGALGLPEQAALYHRLEDEVLRRWTAPIVNDTRCMIAFGLLTRLTGRWVAARDDGGAESLQNDLLCGEGDLKSTEPMRLLLGIAREVDADPALRARFLEDGPESLWAALEDGLAPGVKARFDDYVRSFGHRCVDEL